MGDTPKYNTTLENAMMCQNRDRIWSMLAISGRFQSDVGTVSCLQDRVLLFVMKKWLMNIFARLKIWQDIFRMESTCSVWAIVIFYCISPGRNWWVNVVDLVQVSYTWSRFVCLLVLYTLIQTNYHSNPIVVKMPTFCHVSAKTSCPTL